MKTYGIFLGSKMIPNENSCQLQNYSLLELSNFGTKFNVIGLIEINF
jgi:hypothetical protein